MDRSIADPREDALGSSIVAAALGDAGATITDRGEVLAESFWFESMQNWQSEFLVITVMVVATVWLRQRGSSQSKPVAAPDTQTGG